MPSRSPGFAWSHTATTWRLRQDGKTVAVAIPRRDGWVAIGYDGFESFWLGTYPERDAALQAVSTWAAPRPGRRS